MKLPWNSGELEEKEQKIEGLEERIMELENKKERLEKRFKSEKQRRKKLSRKKQKAEEELNRLKDKLRSREKDSERVEEEPEQEDSFQRIGFGEVRNALRKLDSMESPEKDLVTFYCPGEVEELDEIRDLKNSVTGGQFSELQNEKGFIGFLDQDTGNTLLKMSPFYSQKFELQQFFDVADILEFLEAEKYWALVSAGETKFFRERNGDWEEVEKIKSRVDREHSKGGFSQGRFERKRDEQIEDHVERVKGFLEDLESDEVYLLGDKKLCGELPGEHLGGFDPNRKRPEQFYRFQVKRF